jgi:hypothetical protein
MVYFSAFSVPDGGVGSTRHASGAAALILPAAAVTGNMEMIKNRV